MSFVGGCAIVPCNDENCPRKSPVKIGDCVNCENAEKEKEKRLTTEQKKVLGFYGGTLDEGTHKKHIFHISALEDEDLGPELTQLLLQ